MVKLKTPKRETVEKILKTTGIIVSAALTVITSISQTKSSNENSGNNGINGK